MVQDRRPLEIRISRRRRESRLECCKTDQSASALSTLLPGPGLVRIRGLPAAWKTRSRTSRDGWEPALREAVVRVACLQRVRYARASGVQREIPAGIGRRSLVLLELPLVLEPRSAAGSELVGSGQHAAPPGTPCCVRGLPFYNVRRVLPFYIVCVRPFLALLSPDVSARAWENEIYSLPTTPAAAATRAADPTATVTQTTHLQPQRQRLDNLAGLLAESRVDFPFRR